MMKVKAKGGNRFLIKDEWYQVTGTDVESDNMFYAGRIVHYQLQNHTIVAWPTSWYSSVNFYSIEELREQKLNQLEI